MDTSILPEQPKKDCSLELEKALKSSKLLSSIFVLMTQNRAVDVVEMSMYFNKARSQIYLLCQRLEMFGVACKVAKKGKFYLRKDIYSQDTLSILQTDALATIKG